MATRIAYMAIAALALFAAMLEVGKAPVDGKSHDLLYLWYLISVALFAPVLVPAGVILRRRRNLVVFCAIPPIVVLAYAIVSFLPPGR